MLVNSLFQKEIMKIKLYLIFIVQILFFCPQAISGPHSGIYSGEFTDGRSDDFISIYVMPDNKDMCATVTKEELKLNWTKGGVVPSTIDANLKGRT